MFLNLFVRCVVISIGVTMVSRVLLLALPLLPLFACSRDVVVRAPVLRCLTRCCLLAPLPLLLIMCLRAPQPFTSSRAPPRPCSQHRISPLAVPNTVLTWQTVWMRISLASKMRILVQRLLLSRRVSVNVSWDSLGRGVEAGLLPLLRRNHALSIRDW